VGLNLDCAGTVTSATERTWTSRDAVIYALGVGAGPDELAFSTDDTRGTACAALPTMAVVLATPGPEVAKAMGDYDRKMLVHGSQTTILHAPLPAAGHISARSTILSVFDKGSGAAVETETVATDVETGRPLFTNRSVAFIRGAGGWGGDRGPSVTRPSTPQREPDRRVDYVVADNQALIYRLSGDRNPLHSDPNFARVAGFDRPILHGLCTYGFVGRALVDFACGADPARFDAMSARFVAPMFPGDHLNVSLWTIDDRTTAFEGRRNGDQLVITGGLGDQYA
jgi:acyl dehydratase